MKQVIGTSTQKVFGCRYNSIVHHCHSVSKPKGTCQSQVPRCLVPSPQTSVIFRVVPRPDFCAMLIADEAHSEGICYLDVKPCLCFATRDGGITPANFHQWPIRGIIKTLSTRKARGAIEKRFHSSSTTISLQTSRARCFISSYFDTWNALYVALRSLPRSIFPSSLLTPCLRCNSSSLWTHIRRVVHQCQRVCAVGYHIYIIFTKRDLYHRPSTCTRRAPRASSVAAQLNLPECALGPAVMQTS